MVRQAHHEHQCIENSQPHLSLSKDEAKDSYFFSSLLARTALEKPKRLSGIWEKRMKVSQLLRKQGGRIVSIRMDETIERAAQMLRDENIGALVIKDSCNTEGDVVVGMFSERDFLRAVLGRGPQILKLPVSRLMSPNVISLRSNDDTTRAVELFNKHRIRHLPVIDDHTLVGVISIRDVVAAYEPVALSAEAAAA
jgi:CBS domain-containing protein